MCPGSRGDGVSFTARVERPKHSDVGPQGRVSSFVGPVPDAPHPSRLGKHFR